jgi:hypothetical protein
MGGLMRSAKPAAESPTRGRAAAAAPARPAKAPVAKPVDADFEDDLAPTRSAQRKGGNLIYGVVFGLLVAAVAAVVALYILQ